jgi:formylglycine-generating enzyme required for sulfatase activity
MADSIDEYHETVELALTAGTGYTVGSTSSATVTIAGEDVVIADLGITLKPVAAGTFMMGDLNDAGESNEEPVHEVTLSTGFWMGSTEVTVAQFRAFLQDTDNTDGVDFGSTCPLNNDATYTLSGNAFGTSGDQPMCEISRVASQNFCSWLTTRERAAGRLPATQEYRLPTEAEWEYCCRAGSTTQWCFGNSEAQLAGYAWYESNANDNTREVAQKTANAWGLYDMHGNVFEWCSDYWGDYSASPVTDPTGPATGTDRVCRGGSWKEIAGYSRSAYRRISDVPGSTNPRLGLRLVRATCP